MMSSDLEFDCILPDKHPDAAGVKIGMSALLRQIFELER